MSPGLGEGSASASACKDFKSDRLSGDGTMLFLRRPEDTTVVSLKAKPKIPILSQNTLVTIGLINQHLEISTSQGRFSQLYGISTTKKTH